MEILVTGMHRSGTSMLARMLDICGVYFGPAERLMEPKPDNPEGFWEHLDLIHINNKLLEIGNGAWDVVPELADAAWFSDDRVPRYRRRTGEVIAELKAHGSAVAFKDPRLCFTLPFWLELFPEARVVICFRNPYDVVHSLVDRNGFSELLALKLWFEYNRRVMTVTRPEQRVLTEYAAFFERPEAELSRILGWLGLTPSPATFDRACATVKHALRHHAIRSPTRSGLFDPLWYDRVDELYGRLLDESQAG